MKNFATHKIFETVDPKLIMFIGAVILAFGTYVQNIRSSEKTKELNSNLSDARKQLIDYLTGANSFCYLDASISPFGNDSVHFSIRHVGLYPLKNIQISIISTDDELDQLFSGNLELPSALAFADLNKFHCLGHPYKKNIPILTKGELLGLESFETVDRGQKSYNARFVADNGNVWYQRIILRRLKDYPENFMLISNDDNTYIQATQVYTSERLMNENFDSYRQETILAEGTQWTINYRQVFKDKEEYLSRYNPWSAFPLTLKESETSPFKFPTMHWDGVSLQTGGLVRQKYQQ